MKAGLLKRLNGDSALQGDIPALAAYIALQLQDLFNVRAGSCPSRHDLGLPAISPVQLQGDEVQAQRLAQVIQLQVEHFEPRLQQPKVSTAGDQQGALLFNLQALMEQGYERWQVRFRIRIDSDSRVSLAVLGLQSDGAVRR